MWFFPPIELNKERTLFFRIIIVSFLVHTLMVIGLFLGHIFSLGQSLVLQGSGARVSMAGIAGQSVPGAQPAAYSGQSESQEKVLAVPEVAKKSEVAPLPEKKKAEKKSEPQKVTTPKVTQKASQKELPDPKSAVPAFSELKKKYTTLKKQPAPVSEPKKEAIKKETEKKQEVAKQSQTIQSPSERSATEQLKNEKKIQPPGKGAGQIAGAELLEFGTGGQGSQGIGEGAVGDQPVGERNAIVQEIERHYRRPPGFDDHESFVFSFEIIQGKAVNVSSKGTEPLVIYSAVKEAVLKAKFVVHKQSKKIELLIKSSS